MLHKPTIISPPQRLLKFHIPKAPRPSPLSRSQVNTCRVLKLSWLNPAIHGLRILHLSSVSPNSDIALATIARNITAPANHVRTMYLSPLYAYTPMSLPWVFMRSTALNCTNVTMADAMRSDTEDRDDSTRLPMRPGREIWNRTASAVKILRPAVTIPTV
jgi:hypothetical protein